MREAYLLYCSLSMALATCLVAQPGIRDSVQSRRRRSPRQHVVNPTETNGPRVSCPRLASARKPCRLAGRATVRAGWARSRRLRLDDCGCIAQAGRCRRQPDRPGLLRRADDRQRPPLEKSAPVALVRRAVPAVSVTHGRDHSRPAEREFNLLNGVRLPPAFRIHGLHGHEREILAVRQEGGAIRGQS